MIPPRLALVQPAAFRSDPHRRALISFAEVEEREPIIRATGPTGARAVVIRWPTDDRGLVVADAVRRGETRAVPWDLSPAELGALADLVERGWTFDDHDLQVSGGPDRPHLVPSRMSLRASPWCPRVTEADAARVLAA